MVPLTPPTSIIGGEPKDEVRVSLHLGFYKVKLTPELPDSLIVLIFGDYGGAGRLVYGETQGAQYRILWDSPLLNSTGRLDFEDVIGNGQKQIVWRSATCGAKDCAPQQLVVFDKDGNEISRQSDCPPAKAFDETDGVCPIEGDQIRFTVVSPFALSLEEVERAPKDIVATNWHGSDKDAILTLENRLYAVSTLDAVALSASRKAKNSQQAALLNEEGLKSMREGKYEAAAEDFAKANHLANGDASYIDNVGYAFYRMGKYRESITCFGEAIGLAPGRAAAYLHRADAFVSLHREAEGRQDADAYVKDFCAEGRGRCIAEAQKDYRKYLELAPNSQFVPDVKKKLDALPPSP